jgi:hypothetical protein
MGPVVGAGQVIIKAPGGTPLVVSVAPLGFQTDVPPGTDYPEYYLPPGFVTNKSICSFTPYMLVDAVPAKGWVELDPSSNSLVSSSAEIRYADTTNVFEVASHQTYANVWNGAGWTCALKQLPFGAFLGPELSFKIGNGFVSPTYVFNPPFTAVPWTAPDTDPPTQ